MRFLLILIPGLFWTCQAIAAGWGKIAGEHDNPWSDYADVSPHVYPDGWSVDQLAKYSDDEVMLRSSEGAMLRWLPISQVRVLSSVRRQMSKVAETRVDFFIIKGDQPNAAAGHRKGNPTMFVNFGMLDLIGEDRDLWAALIGHEIAHLKFRHIESRSKRSIPMGIIKGVANAALGTDPITSTAGGLLVDGVGLKFDRDAERQSDYMGVIWAIEAGYQADGAARLHAKMSERSANLSIPFLSSHPSSKERIKTLTELAERMSP